LIFLYFLENKKILNIFRFFWKLKHFLILFQKKIIFDFLNKLFIFIFIFI